MNFMYRLIGCKRKELDMAEDYNTKKIFHYSSKDMIHEKDVYPPLLKLIKESNGEMLFVDSDDERFSKKELERMMEEILLIHDSLSFVVDINLDENADYKICIYEDALKLIYNDECLEKALPKPWESENNIWLFLQDHQEPKWEKLIRKNHRIQEVWNQRTMLTVPL